jgi:phosphatidyl-myo-inositol dimannoside synthase
MTDEALLICYEFPPLRGGYATYALGVARHLTALRVRVLTRSLPGVDADPRLAGIDVHRTWVKVGPFPRLGEIVRAGLFSRAARKICKRYPVRLIMAEHVLDSGCAAWWTHRRTGLPYAVIAHGEEIDWPYDRTRLRWRDGIYRGAALVATVSHHSRDLLLKRGVSTERIVLAHPGIDTERFDRPADPRPWRARLGIPDGARVILTVGRMIRRKGQDLTIEALPEIRRRAGDVHYVICGWGPMESILRARAEALGLASCVHFAGVPVEDELPAVYRMADVFVMPSRPEGADTEGFGIVYLEAGACGVPVVGGRSGGVPDAVDDGRTGLLVDPQDPGAIAEAVARLLLDCGLAKRMGEEAQRRARTEWTWPSRLRALDARIKDIVEKTESGKKGRDTP